MSGPSSPALTLGAPRWQHAARRVLPLLAFWLLPLLLFWPTLWGGATMLPFDNLYQGLPWYPFREELGVGAPHNELLSDLILQNYQWKGFAVSQLRAGELPLWQPHQFAGTPFLAAGQHGMLYPLSLLFHVLPIPTAFGWFTVASLALAGTTMYALARTLGLSRTAALLAGLTYQGSGFLTTSAVFPMVVSGAAWLPLLLAALHRLSQSAEHRAQSAERTDNDLLWMGVGAVAIGMAALAGHVEILYYTLLVGGLYGAWRVGSILRKGKGQRAQGKGHKGTEDDVGHLATGATLTSSPALPLSPSPAPPLSHLLRFLTTGLATLLIGLLLGAGQLVPLYELVAQNFREGSASLAQVQGYAWPLRQAASFLVPDLLGNPARHRFYNLTTRQWEPIVTQQPVDDAGNTTSLDHVAWFKGGPQWKNYVEGAGYLGVLPLLLAALALVPSGEGKRQRAKGRRQKETEHGGTQGRKGARAQGVKQNGKSHVATGNGQLPMHDSHVPANIVQIESPLFFALLALLSILFIFGTPLYAVLFYGLPGWSQLHTPFRWVFPLTLAISILAAIGWDKHRSKGGNRFFSFSPLASQLSLLPVAAAVLGLLLLAAMWLAPDPWVAQAAKLLDRSQLAQWAFGGSAALFVSYQWANFLHLGLALLAAGLVLRLASRLSPLPSRRVPTLAALVVGVDLLAAAWGFFPRVPQRVAGFTPPALVWLAERHEPGAWRFATLEKDWKVFNANSTMGAGLEGIQGYDSIIPKPYVQFMEAVAPQSQLAFNRIAPLRLEAEQAPDQELLDLLNVRYLVTDQPLSWPGWTLAYDGEVRIYENTDVLPRAFLLGNVTFADGRGDAEFRAQLQGMEPRREVLLEFTSSDIPRSDLPFTPVAFTSYMPNEIGMRINPPQAGWLVLSDTDFPGWRVFGQAEGAAEEQELLTRRANGAFRAVWVEAGAQTVRWKYTPDSVKVGFFASFLGVAALGLLGAVWAWGRLYVARDDEGTARRVARNAGAPMALQLFNKAIDTVFAAFMARFLGPAALGQYAFAVTLLWGFIIFSNFGLGTLLTRDAARDPAATDRLFSTTLLLRAALFFVGLPLLLALLVLWPPAFGALERETRWAIALLALGLLPNNIADAITAVFRARERFEIPALVATLATFIKVSLGAGVLLAGGGIVGLAATSMVTNFATLVLLAGWMVRGLHRPRWERARLPWRPMLGDAWPLALNEFLATAFFRIDQVLLKPLRGNTEAGYYNVAYKFIDGLLILPSSFTLAAFPVMSRYAQAQAEEQGRRAQGDGGTGGEGDGGSGPLHRATVLALRWLVVLALPIALLTTRFAVPIVLLFGGPAFLPEAGTTLQVLIWFLPFSFVNSLLQYVLIAAGQQHRLTRAYGWALGFNIVANLLAIRAFGLYGAALVTILSELALLGPFGWLMRRSVGPLPWATLFLRPLLALALTALPLWLLPAWLGLPASLLTYGAALLALRTLTPDDRALLAKLLPAGAARRLRLA